ncbi:response regulator transcription factor [Marinobacter sp. NSM]|uniref:response regulator transcription factor n=1 Tax=Marinobacter sp. NSM TaxID=3458004 RepID=UPI004036F40C
MIATTPGWGAEATPASAASLFERVLLVDDHALFAQGLAGLIEQELLAAQVNIVSSVEVAADALRHDGGIDLVLLDVALNGEVGLSLFARLSDQRARPPIVIISSSDDEETVRAARAAGARGFLAKSAGRASLVRMMRAVAQGQSYFPGGVTAFSTDELPLTPRQREVLSLLAQGFPNKRICQSLDLTEHTVKTHLKAIFTQLGVHNRTECVNKARKLGWL